MSAHIDTTPVPIPESRLEQHYDNVVPMQATQANRWRTVATDRRTHLWLSIILNVALICLLMVVLPNRELIPIVLYNGPDGLQIISTTVSDLPPSVEVASIEARLWFYLHHRESYNSIEGDDYYNIASAMSDATVRMQYQNWANAKKNKNAPANLLGKDGWIRNFKLSSGFVTHDGDYHSGVYRINYCKVTYGGQGEAMRAQPMTEIISYTLVRRIPFLQRTTFNPEALVVVGYPGSDPLKPAADVILGAMNPCGVLS